MPHLTLQVSPSGPIIEVLVGVSTPRAEVLAKQNKTVPKPVVARLLVDTGASGTCMDPAIIKKLAISPTGQVQILTPSTGNNHHTCNTYDVNIILVHSHSRDYKLATVEVMESRLECQGIDGLLGRDILSECLLVYDGENKFFTLAF